MTPRLFESRTASFDSDLWNAASSLDMPSLLSLAEQHSREPYFALQILLRWSSTSPLDLIEQFSERFRGVRVRRNAASDGGVVQLRSSDGALQACMACLPGANPGVWHLCTAAKSRTPEHDHLIAPVLNGLASRIQPGWLSSSELESALISLQRRANASVSPSRVASRGFDRSAIEWRKAATLEQVVTELRDNQLLMQSVEFKLMVPNRKTPVLNAAVSRALRVVYRSGTARFLELYLLPELELLLATHFSHTAVRQDEWGKRRIIYRFEQDALMNRESHSNLVDALAEQSKLMVCAYHLNPYLNLGVTDLVDGSVLNLISDSPGYMYVMPGKRCTAGAVSRVLDAVYDRFAAGRVLRSETDQDGWRASEEAPVG